MAETVLTYEYDSIGMTYSVTGAISIADDGVLIIPEKYNDITNGEHPIVCIKENAFNKTKSTASDAYKVMIDKIKSLFFSKNIKKIELGAFANSSTLAKIVFDNGGNVEIDRSAFYNCTALTEVILPTVTFVDSYTGGDGNGHQFSSCTSLRSVVFNGKAYTQSKTFSNCANLTIEFKDGDSYGPMGPYYPYGAVKNSLIVKSSNELLKADMDFLGFTFNGLHSYLDLKTIRVSDGDRYNTNLTPEIVDLTAENPSTDGTYYFNSRHKVKKFNINLAFERLTDVDIRKWKQFCANKNLSDLIFDEEPYKVYTAKITGQPNFKFIPFDEVSASGVARVYRGEGSIEFTCYWPYAHTPNEETKVSLKMLVDGKFGMNGMVLNSYDMFINKEQWGLASGITNSTGACGGENPGDLPAPFVLSKSGLLAKDSVIKVGDLEVTLNSNVYNLKWDSKTGIISGTDYSFEENTRTPISFSGISVGGIPVGNSITWGLLNGDTYLTTDMTLEYHYWYY